MFRHVVQREHDHHARAAATGRRKVRPRPAAGRGRHQPLPARTSPTPPSSAAVAAGAAPPAASAAPAGSPAPAAPPTPAAPPAPDQARLDAHRLLFRAGFGPRPGDVERLAGMTRQEAVYSLTRPTGEAQLTGPEPHTASGSPLSPFDQDGDDHLWWFDRMVRSDQPLVERLTLVFHDWFATSNEKVANQKQMIDQNNLIRSRVLGSFADLFHDITIDPAMLIWLDGTSNLAGSPNENYGREMMELFTLGADRGAYSQSDVSEQARALTGWTSDHNAQQGNFNFRLSPARHDSGSKTILGQTGNFGWEDSVRLCVAHPLHPSFFVTKLWSYFMPTAIDPPTVQSLAGIYTSSGWSIQAVVEAILLDDRLYSGPAMVKPPVVHAAGMLRALQGGIITAGWVGIAQQTGQRLFHPPDVSGWPKDRWLDTSTFKGRWDAASVALMPSAVDSDNPPDRFLAPESPAEAVAAALSAVGDPPLSAATLAALQDVAARMVGGMLSGPGTEPGIRVMRFNALRHLILTSPDYQTC